jgi:hypothetical protein
MQDKRIVMNGNKTLRVVMRKHYYGKEITYMKIKKTIIKMNRKVSNIVNKFFIVWIN